MSGAGLEADVEGVGPTVVLKQMYYRHRLDLSCAPDLGPPAFPPFLSFHYSRQLYFLLFSTKQMQFGCSAAPRLSARCSFQMWLSLALFFFSPSLPLPTMLFLFLSGSSYKHLLCESDKPYPKPQREPQPKATNRGRP